MRKYWIWISIGFMLTEVSVKQAYRERGYIAYGGEWLVFPFVLVIGYFINEIRIYQRDSRQIEREKDYDR